MMYEVRAYIKPIKLSDVTLALHEVEGLTGVTVTDVRGFGRPKPKGTKGRYDDELTDYGPYCKLEIVCQASLVERIVDTIRRAAHTGLRGDGKIYVSRVLAAVRISTGERKGLAVIGEDEDRPET